MQTRKRFAALVLMLFAAYVAGITSRWTLYAQEPNTEGARRPDATLPAPASSGERT